jgi:hypothetical protein
MLSAMNAIRAMAGGQRDSPRSTSASRGSVAASTLGSRHESSHREAAALALVSGGATQAERRVELLSAVLLALATVATAWSAYQSRQWIGEQSQAYSRATAARIAENRFAALANRQVQIDVATFIEWVDARQEVQSTVALALFALIVARAVNAFA